MKNLPLIFALIFSFNLTAQNVKIETKFVLLGMINDQWMTKKGECKYHIDTFSNKDTLQFRHFLRFANLYFQQNALEPDLIIETDRYGWIKVASKTLTKELKGLFINKPSYYKFFYRRLFPKRVTLKCGDKYQKQFIRATDYKKLKTLEKKLSFMKGAFLRNGRFYNDTIELSYSWVKFDNHKIKSNPEILFKILSLYIDELRTIELIERIHPLLGIVTLRLYNQIIDRQKLKNRAVEPKPNTMGPYRPNPLDYLEIKEKTNTNSKS